MKKLKVGDKVKFVSRKRDLKEGFKREDYHKEMRQWLSSTMVLSERKDIINKYFLKPKVSRGTSVITKVDSRTEDLGVIVYELKNGKSVYGNDVKRIPFHKGFSELLEKCEESSSTITRTGLFYSYNGKVIIEYMTSTKNVWLDDEIVATIRAEEKELIIQEIKSFLPKVNNINFGLGINETIKERDEILNRLFSEYK